MNWRLKILDNIHDSSWWSCVMKSIGNAAFLIIFSLDLVRSREISTHVPYEWSSAPTFTPNAIYQIIFCGKLIHWLIYCLMYHFLIAGKSFEKEKGHKGIRSSRSLLGPRDYWHCEAASPLILKRYEIVSTFLLRVGLIFISNNSPLLNGNTFGYNQNPLYIQDNHLLAEGNL